METQGVQSQLDSCDGGKSCDSLKLLARGEPTAPLGTCGQVNEDDRSSTRIPAPPAAPQCY